MDGYVGELRIFSGNYAPEGWALCNGQLLTISGYETLFSLIGTTYGGDGQTTFAVPNLQATVAVGVGQGPGQAAPYVIGKGGGAAQVTLTEAAIPNHTHAQNAATSTGTSTTPNGNLFAAAQAPAYGYYNNPPAANQHPIASNTVTSAGGGQGHNNVMPCLGLTYIIATNGVYPTFPT